MKKHAILLALTCAIILMLCGSVSAADTPPANFTANMTSGSMPLSVQFNYTSTGNLTSQNRHFRDGNNSTSQNPVHTYTSLGAFNTILNATNSEGSSANYLMYSTQDTINTTNMVQTMFINLYPDYLQTGTDNDVIRVDYNFTNLESFPAFNVYGWYSYSNQRIGIVMTNGLTSEYNIIGISPVEPVIILTANTTSGLNFLTEQFNNTSINNPTGWIWGFGDGTTSTDENPIYITPENYTITLTATNIDGNNTVTEIGYITIFNSTQLNITATQDAGTYDTTQTVTLNRNQPRSTIYHNIHGSYSTDSKNSNRIPYSNPIPVTNTTLFNFATMNQGDDWSQRYSKKYIIDTVAPTASANLTGGTYNTTQTVALTSNDPTATIYYAVDTTDPRISSTRIHYTRPITIINTTTLRFAAVNPAGNWSPLYLQNYVIGNEDLANTTWPKYAEEDNTCQSIAGLQTNNGKWSYLTGNQVYSSPAIGADGTIYFGSSDDKLYALNHEGTLKWSYTTGGNVTSSPAIGSDGTIYFGSYDDYFYALNPDGTLQWRYYAGILIDSSPAIGADGTIYFGDYNGKVYALNPDGTLKWNYTTENFIESTPTIGSDETIYIGSGNYELYAFNPDGTVKWTYTTESYVLGSTAVGSDGTIYFGSYGDSDLYALNPNGTLQWYYPS